MAPSSLYFIFFALLRSVLNARCVIGLPQQPINKLQWENCGEVDNHALECTRLVVPMDHFNTSRQQTFSIPLIRMLATKASRSGGRHIILNPGGPGTGGVDWMRDMGEFLNQIVGESFHLLSFDPRGVEGSIPKAVCYPDNSLRLQDLENDPFDARFEAGAMYTKTENFAKACEDVMGDYAGFVNTPQTAADMNLILDAIGQEKMYYWGFSYGTLLGQTNAQMFPDRIARMALDGIIDMDVWYNSFDYMEYFLDSDRVYEGFLEECFRAKEACPLFPVRGASFKTSAELKTYIDEFLAELEAEPIPVYLDKSTYGSVTRRNLVDNGIYYSLSEPSEWSTLAENLAALLNGDSTPAYNEYPEAWVGDFSKDESIYFVNNNDNRKSGLDAPVRGISAMQDYLLSRPQISILISRYQGPDLSSRASWSIPLAHNFQPQYYPDFPAFKTAYPILIISTTWDPGCPLISAKRAHSSFEGAGFVEQQSYGHCSISMPSVCTAGYVRRYFNEGVLPEEGTTCGIDDEYFPASPASSIFARGDDHDDMGALMFKALKGKKGKGKRKPPGGKLRRGQLG